jgi:N-acetylmuramic acid 6-phosphate etherase
VDHRIVLATGPERIAGSTRMKAGTAAKMALGLLSSAAFVRLGAVRAGRMVALRPASEKLRRRAVRTVAELGGVSEAAARRLLSAAGWDVARAVEAAERPGRSR